MRCVVVGTSSAERSFAEALLRSNSALASAVKFMLVPLPSSAVRTLDLDKCLSTASVNVENELSRVAFHGNDVRPGVSDFDHSVVGPDESHRDRCRPQVPPGPRRELLPQGKQVMLVECSRGPLPRRPTDVLVMDEVLERAERHLRAGQAHDGVERRSVAKAVNRSGEVLRGKVALSTRCPAGKGFHRDASGGDMAFAKH